MASVEELLESIKKSECHYMAIIMFNEKTSELKLILEVGGIVMRRLEAFERESKFDGKYSSPYKIVRNFRNRGYEIKNLFGKKFRYNLKDLMLMEDRP